MTTTSSSIRAAEIPSDAGQYVSISSKADKEAQDAAKKLLTTTMLDETELANDYDRWLRGMRRLSALTLGLVGLGKIGTEVARRMAPFGFRILGHDPLISATHADWSETKTEMVGLEELLSRADASLYTAKRDGRNRACFDPEMNLSDRRARRSLP